MPGDTVQIIGKDGSSWTIPKDNLPKALARGARLAGPPPGPVQRFGTSLVGVPENIDVTKMGSWLDALKQTAQSFNVPGSSAAASRIGMNRFQQPGIANKLVGGTEYALGGIPMVGPMAVNSMEQAGRGDIAGSMGSAISTGAAAAGFGKAAPDAANYIAAAKDELPRRAMQWLTESGKTGTKFAEYQHNTVDLPKIRAENHQKLLDATDALRQAEYKDLHEATDTNRQVLLDAQSNYKAAAAAAERRGLLLDAAERSRNTLATELPKIKEQATAVAKSLYPDVNGSVDASKVAQNVRENIANHLYGVGKVPSILQRILSDAAPSGPVAAGGEFIDSGNEAAHLAGKPWDFNKLHGTYTELGQAYDPNMSGDERAAIQSTKKFIGDQMQQLAEAEGKGYRFDVAQKNWAKLENTFNNTDSLSKGGSPIAHALQARDPITGQIRPEFVQKALSDDIGYGIARRMLEKYPQLQSELDTMKHGIDSASDLPESAPDVAKTSGWKKYVPESIADIKYKSEAPFDSYQWRLDFLKKTADRMSGMSQYETRPYGLRYAFNKRVLFSILADPKSRAWLARDPVAMRELANAGIIPSAYIPPKGSGGAPVTEPDKFSPSRPPTSDSRLISKALAQIAKNKIDELNQQLAPFKKEGM